MFGDGFAVQREHRLEQSVVSIKPNKYTPTDRIKNLSGFLHLYEKLPFSAFFHILQLHDNSMTTS